MTSRKHSITIAALALIASACAGTPSSVRTSGLTPAGQAAQPWSWDRPEPHMAVAERAPGGRAGQPWSGPALKPESEASTWQFALGTPAGRAAQPGGWNKSVQ